MIDLTSEELADLFGLVESGQARLLRLSAQITAHSAGELVLSSGTAVLFWEAGRIPRDLVVRRRYYAFLCDLRKRLGEITVAYGSEEKFRRDGRPIGAETHPAPPSRIR